MLDNTDIFVERYVKNLYDNTETIFYKGIMPSEKGFRFSSGL